MTDDPNNPPAFPSLGSVIYPSGMSLRDWFAGQALAGVMSRPRIVGDQERAKSCYDMADAMLAERAKVQPLTTARTIAEGLTKAQRRAVLALTHEPQPAKLGVFSAVAAFNLVSLRVTAIKCVWSNEFPQGRDCYRLTPLGEQVRAILIEQEKSHG